MLDSIFKKGAKWSLVAAIALLLTPDLAKAAPARKPPENLTELLGKLETAANNADLEVVRAAYSSDFTTASGLNPSEMAQKLEQFWENYSRVDYRIELQSWEKQGDAIVAETVTRVRGLREAQGRDILLEATLRSRQRIVDGKITMQEMLSERSQVYIGDNAPRVTVNAPDQVRVGKQFNFDVIVREPVGDDILLGTALEEEVTASNYLNSRELDLEILPAGGIYRLGEAPTAPGKRWLSAIIVRDDGITLVSQRLNIVPAKSALSNPKKD
jgi:hypothetical protein